MKISIITVCKNAIDTIEKTLLSIYGQTYKDIEHIVIDGGSNDGTLALLSRYKDNISILISEPDTGIYNAMNKGIKLATGDIVYFLNATDSLYDERVLEKIADEFNKHNDLEILWGDIVFTEEEKEPRIYKNDVFKAKNDFLYNNPCHQAILYKNELFKQYGDYDEAIKIFGDYDLNIRMLVTNNAKCKYIPELIAKFEIGGISTSSEEDDRVLHRADRKMVFDKNFKNKYSYRLDKFITKIFGTPVKAFKQTKLHRFLFCLSDKVSQIIFKQRLSLNFVD